MKEGRTLRELAKEVDRRRRSKVDFAAKVSALTMAVGQGKLPVLQLTDKKTPRAFNLNDVAHEQVADYVGIPMQYYRRLRDSAPDLLANEVNRWLMDKQEDERMVRTMDGRVRALLSAKYRPLENEDLLEAILPVLKDRNLEIMSCDVTDQRLYLKAIDLSTEKEVPTGRELRHGGNIVVDTCCPAVVVSNSEVGRGSLLIEGGYFTKGCTNMGIYGASMRKFHTGAKADISDEHYAVLSTETRKVTDAAVWLQARDLVIAALDHAQFSARLERLAEAAGDRLPKKADVVKVIDLVGKRFGLADDERKGVLQCLIEDGDLSRYGVHSAITRFSQDEALGYDRATDLERAGAKVIELSRGEWEQIAKAA